MKITQCFFAIQLSKYTINIDIISLSYPSVIQRLLMRLRQHQIINDIKTWNCEQSDIDLFSKMQASFLEKFFRYNLSDYLSNMLVNLYQDQFQKKISSKTAKMLTSQFFICRNCFVVEQFQQKVENFYRSKSSTLEAGELPYAFRLRYCNRNPMPNLIKKNQLIFIEVKVKAEVRKIQQLPSYAIRILQNYTKSEADCNKFEDQKFDRYLQNYREQFITMFICYFGDTNFHIFKKVHYEVTRIKILKRTYKLRIFVFYISRQAMIETFKSLNKIATLDYINDLVIQFYQMKREKQRSKRIKKPEKMIKFKNSSSIEINILKLMGAIGLLAAGFFFAKIMM